jgi:SNF2 family DNA or RNA helicase
MVKLNIEGNRAVVSPPLDKSILTLTPRLEGVKKWLKGGGLSFEVTPSNMERFRAMYPDATITGEARLDFEEKVLRKIARNIAYIPIMPPFPFQDRAVTLSWDKAAYAYFMEMGTGKTYVTINVFGRLWCQGKIDGVLIIAPKGVHAQWIEDEIPKHLGKMVPYRAVIWKGKKTDISTLHGEDGVLNVFAINEDAIRTTSGEEACLKFIEQNQRRVMMIVDESQSIKNTSTQITKAAIALGKCCLYRRILTGTPIAKNLVDAFSQLQFLDQRIIGFKYKASFIGEYCVLGGEDGREVVGSKNVEQFWRRISNHSFRVTKEEADLQLPPKHYVRTPFEMTDEQKRIYTIIKQDFFMKMESGAIVDAAHAAGALVKLQQISNGFLVGEIRVENEGEVTKERETLVLPNARMVACRSVVEEREGKIVIWARFTYDILALKDEFGNEAVTYNGATSTLDRKKAIEQFLDPSSSVRILIANPAAAGVGLNLQGDCRTVIYYSNSFNAIDRWQSEDRVHRHGMKYAVTYFDLVCRGTPDAKILANLRNKKALSDLALDDIRQLFGE